MEYAYSNETHYVRCLKCLKILRCSRYDTSALLQHIRTDHPEIEIVEEGAGQSKKSKKSSGSSKAPSQTSSKVQPRSSGNSKADSTGEKISIRSLQISVNTPPQQGERPRNSGDAGCACSGRDENTYYTRRFQMGSPSASSTLPPPRKRSLYRTSIEKWRPASGTIYCPQCGTKKQPLIRTRAERLSTNSCGAACILGCWPFCFLPYLCPGQSNEYLHCANCKAFLGLYDRDHNCVKPNKQFVECDVVTEHAIHK